MLTRAQIFFYSGLSTLNQYRWLLMALLMLAVAILALLSPQIAFADEVTGGSGCFGC